MARKGYGQFCGLVRAVEIVGERWALLIIRDLLVGARRYTDLLNGLPGIPTNILASRLKELEEAGVVTRRLLPHPKRSVVYELTEYGRELEPAVLALGRWGAKALTEPEPDEIVTTSSMMMALRSTFRPEATRELEARFELRMGEIVINVRIENGTLEIEEGEIQDAALVIETDPAIKALMAAELSPSEALAKGSVNLTGDPALLTRFVEAFRI